MASEDGGTQVSVIIPSLRNHEELEIVLDGLANQTWPTEGKDSLEVVVVGPSGDPGEAVAKANGPASSMTKVLALGQMLVMLL